MMIQPQAPDRRRTPAFGSVVPLLIDTQQALVGAPSFYEPGTIIHPGRADSSHFFGSGWNQREMWGRWSTRSAELYISIDPLRRPRHQLVLQALLTIYEPHARLRRVEVVLDGKPLLRFIVPPGDGRPRLIRCPVSLATPFSTLSFVFPDAGSPGATGGSDNRVLGGGFQWLMLSHQSDVMQPVPDGAVLVDAAIPPDASSVHPMLPLAPRPAVEWEGAWSNNADNSPAWLIASNDASNIRSDDFALTIDPRSSDGAESDPLALLVLLESISLTVPATVSIEVEERAFSRKIPASGTRWLALRVGPLLPMSKILRGTVRIETSAPTALKLHLITAVGWYEKLPPLMDGIELIDVLPPPRAIPERTAAMDAVGLRTLTDLVGQVLDQSAAQTRRLAKLEKLALDRPRTVDAEIRHALEALSERLDRRQADMAAWLDTSARQLAKTYDDKLVPLSSLVSQLQQSVDNAPTLQRSLIDESRKAIASNGGADLEGGRRNIRSFPDGGRSGSIAKGTPQVSVPVMVDAVGSNLTELLVGIHQKLDAMKQRVAIPLNDDTMIVGVDGGYVLVPRSDYLLLAMLFDANGLYEADTVAVFGRFVEPTMHVVDVGANVGVHTVKLARLASAGRVTAVEPSPDLALLLQRTVAINGLAGSVDIVAKAAGAERGTGRLNAGITSGHASFLTPSADRGSSTVDVAPLDTLVKGDADIVKIDVEGMEMAVLLGMSRLLQNPDIVLVVEFGQEHLVRAGVDIDSWFDAFRSRGFEGFSIGPGGALNGFDAACPQDGNYLFVRRKGRQWTKIAGK